ncbi:velvet factor-domain-containing protein [Dichotomocladium elegans]|nr:velvet factor-domain-containing protein [Dichotomocladium elegans]
MDRLPPPHRDDRPGDNSSSSNASHIPRLEDYRPQDMETEQVLTRHPPMAEAGQARTNSSNPRGPQLPFPTGQFQSNENEDLPVVLPPIAGYRSSSMKLKRSDKVLAMMGVTPKEMPSLFPAPQGGSLNTRSYIMRVVEQPQQCRACGFSSSGERRPIDPVPIVQLEVRRHDGLQDQESYNNPFYVLHARLCSVDMTQTYENVHNQFDTHGQYGFGESSRYSVSPLSTSVYSIMLGTFVSSCSTYLDLMNRRYIYFSFPDLSVRLPGNYRLCFSLMSLGRSSSILSEIYSEPFVVYPAKAFPGMKESSALAIHLNQQGMRIPIRTRTRPKRKSVSGDDDNNKN